ncbi:MAG: Gfo/Idh/MocA family oxidoreductase [Bacteroidales bacterium]|nr:Gfo/Idh/MocA family oxidoreductase [Bacteroidales bacterium]MCF8390798.1 Gfo/Idh/MocA family oxidoreductase [Bacteroidales bacterium]
MKPIKTGIASFGMSGYVFHGPLLHCNNGFEIKSIIERKNNTSKKDYSYAKILRSCDELCEEKDIELVIVNLPDYLHFDFARKALLAGKHVVIEKPFTQTSEQADELIEIAKKKGLVLSVFQNRRWDSDFLTVQRLIKEKAFGTLVEYEAHFDRYRNVIAEGSWKESKDSGAGTLFNLGSHLIDQALVLFGWPETIFADIRTTRPNSTIDDNFELILSYPGLKVSLKASYLVREQGPKYLVHGTEGSFIKYGMDCQEDDLKAGLLPVGKDWGKEDPQFWGTLNTNLNDKHFRGSIESEHGNYMAFYDNIYQAIRNGAELAVKPEQAADVIRIIEAAYLSDREGRIIRL